MDAGHFYPKSLGLSVYFVEKMVHAQCQYCNLVLQGNQVEYAKALVKKYGEGILEELEQIKKTTVKFSRIDYVELIEKYKELTKGVKVQPSILRDVPVEELGDDYPNE